MRYYEQRYPEVDELVMVQVRQIAEMGAYVKLVSLFVDRSGRSSHVLQLEYDNIEGMILLSELSRRRIRSIQKLIRVGRNEVVVVLRVDREKGLSPPSSLIAPLFVTHSPSQDISIFPNAVYPRRTSQNAKNGTRNPRRSPVLCGTSPQRCLLRL